MTKPAPGSSSVPRSWTDDVTDCTDAPEQAALGDDHGTSARFRGTTSRKGHLTLEQVHAEHFGFICRSLRGLGVAPAGIEDAAQEVLLVVHRRLHEFEPHSTVQSWLFTIASFVARNHWRTRRRKAMRPAVEIELQLKATNTETGPEETLEAREALRITEQFLDRLDEGKRAVFVLALLEEMPASEVSVTLGIPINTVYSRVRLLREEFRAVLKHHYPELLG